MIHSVSHTSRYGAAGLYCILKSQNKKGGILIHHSLTLKKKKKGNIYITGKEKKCLAHDQKRCVVIKKNVKTLQSLLRQ